MVFNKFKVLAAVSENRLFDFISPEPNDRCDVSDNNWPGVRAFKHGDEPIKSDSSKSTQIENVHQNSIKWLQ